MSSLGSVSEDLFGLHGCYESCLGLMHAGLALTPLVASPPHTSTLPSTSDSIIKVQGFILFVLWRITWSLTLE